jgi:hypothetical protein
MIIFLLLLHLLIPQYYFALNLYQHYQDSFLLHPLFLLLHMNLTIIFILLLIYHIRHFNLLNLLHHYHHHNFHHQIPQFHQNLTCINIIRYLDWIQEQNQAPPHRHCSLNQFYKLKGLQNFYKLLRVIEHYFYIYRELFALIFQQSNFFNIALL